MKKLLLFTSLIIGGLQSNINTASAQILCISCYEQNDSISQNVNNFILNGGFENTTCISNDYTSCFNPNSNYYSCTVADWICTGGGTSSYASIDDNTFTQVAEGTRAAYFGNGVGANACSAVAYDTSCFVTTNCEITTIPVGYPTAPDLTYGGTVGESMEQTVSGLTIGSTYVLEFWAGGEPQSHGWMDPGLFAVDIGFGYTFLRDNATCPGCIGTTFVIQFNATSTTHTIKFTNWGHVCIPCTELILDNVRLYTLAELSPIVTPCGVSVPNAQFTSPTEICPGTCINYTNLSSNATTYQWSFPGGSPSTSTDANPQNICYETSGVYDVTLIATNGSGSDTLTTTNYITVYPSPTAPTLTQSGDTLFATQGFATYQWYFGNDTIVGATNYFYVATVSGNYNVAVADSNGCRVAAGILNVIAGVFGAGSSEFGVSVYPNPTSGVFEIKYYSEKNSPAIFELINSLGQIIYKEEKQMKQGRNSISPIANEAGIYLLKISCEGKIITKKIIVEK